MPIEPGTKQPARGIKSWSGYCDNLPKSETRASWLQIYHAHGIGLCLGTTITPEFRLGAVDVDDDSIVRCVRAILGTCPSAKRGKKGITFFVRVPRNGKIRSCKITNHAKIGVIDVLIGGRLTVLPPTKHPETSEPYVWVGTPLLETQIDDLPVLDDRKLSLLRLVIGAEEATVLATGKVTHDAGLRLVAKMVQHDCVDATIMKVFQSLLPPDYAGNSLDELPEWIESARVKGFDQPKGRKPKESLAERLHTLFNLSGATLFHDSGKRGFMTVPVPGGSRHLPLRSSEGRLWLTRTMYEADKKVIAAKSLDEAINLLEARARFDAPECVTYLRVGGDSSRVLVDLRHDDGTMVSITASGWTVTHNPDVKFTRSGGFAKLPIPMRSKALDELKGLLGLSDTAWTLVLAFLIGCLRPTGPYMLLLVEGEQGSGKSFLCQIIKRIIDPNQIEKARLPESERDLMIHAKDYYLLVFDNVAGMKGDLSDALCVLATGWGLGTRKLYSDDELYVFNSSRPMIINGIADFASRPDLLERAILLRLPAMVEKGRRTETKMLAEFDRLLPGILGGLYDIIAGALKAKARRAPPTRLRMADYAHWLAAAEKSAGQSREAFIKAIAVSQDEVFIERAENDLVVNQLLNLVEKGPFEGTIGVLFDQMPMGYSDRAIPATPAHLSRHLVRMKPAMAKAGIHFAFLPKRRSGRFIRVWLTGQENDPATGKLLLPAY